MSKAIVLLSGGLDSTTCASMACKDFGPSNVIALSIGYGQKHKIELECAKDIVKRLGISKHVIKELPPIFDGSKSTLISSENLDNPELTYKELQEREGVLPTYVPFRNGILLSIAAALALKEEADTIFYGAHASDSRNWAYPDCTPEFNGAMANAIFVGTYMKIRLLVPLQYMTKLEVVRKGLELNAPYDLTRSCYDAGEIACGKCSTCIERIHAFEEAGSEDPILYQTHLKSHI
jgi:7-cyano-7-deazaguanine synthase